MPSAPLHQGVPVVDLVGGARPNFMKLASVFQALKSGGLLHPRIIHTGQHYDDAMSRVFFDQLGLPEPYVHLGVGSGPHGAQTVKMLHLYEAHLLRDRPAATVVFGDVNSTVACALAASKLLVPVVHVEAGLRSHDRGMPEEINRIVTDHLADLLLVTEESGVEQLLHEGVDPERVRLVGNTMIDTLRRFLPEARARARCAEHGMTPRAYALLSLHRPANVDDESVLRKLIGCAQDLAEQLPVLFPVHPRTRRRCEAFGIPLSDQGASRLKAIPPEGYIENLSLMADAGVVLTDSGGMQQEAAELGVPCIVLRDTTEHLATREAGACRVVGSDVVQIAAAFSDAVEGRWTDSPRVALWDGRAGERVAAALAHHIGSGSPSESDRATRAGDA